MNNSLHDGPEIKERRSDDSLTPPAKVETNEQIKISLEEPDTILSMIVLLLTCLGLAALAHVFV